MGNVAHKSTIQPVPKSQILDSQYFPTFPYGTVGLNNHFFPSLPPPNAGVGSDILVSPYVTFTAAHTLIFNGENAENSVSFLGAIPNGSGGTNGSGAFNTFNGSFVSTDLRYSNGYDANQNRNDYGVLRQEEPFLYSFYSNFRRENSYPRTVNVVGYPRDLTGMHKGTATANKNQSFICTNNNHTIHYPMNTMIGMSGGPIFNADNTFITGIHGYHCTFGGITYGNGIEFNQSNLEEIITWLWFPTGTMDIHYPEPNIDINLVAIQDFDANFSPFNLINIHGEIEINNNNVDDSIRWESSINGVLGTGGELDADILKSALTSGNHRITAIIDSNGESGEKNVNVTIIRPEGQFTSPNHCITDLANPNNCDFDLSWTVTDTPEISVVLNDTTGNEFATGNSGSQTVTATNANNVNFKLYPSDQKKILLDELNTNSLSRKTPTGTLSRALNTCSLQPTPIDPVTLQVKDLSVIKETPSGCDVELSWSNIRWASPSIYYRKSGQLNWTHLYQIPCSLNGSVCTGSINTRDIIPQLVLASGTQFKLLQFDQVNSGQLSAPFTVTGHRYADMYEFDDGKKDRFDYLGVGIPTAMAYDHRMSTEAIIGVAQHNHSFHGPAVYDTIEDIDTIQVCTNNQFPEGQIACQEKFPNGKTLEVTVFNMSNGLDVDMALQCGGIGSDPNDPLDGQSIVADFITNQTDPITTDPLTGAKTMRFRVHDHTEAIGSDIACKTNRVVITRAAGTPSENLTYSVVINDPDAPTGPVINSTQSLCNHNYCVRLLGIGFGSNASVRIRENIAGSATIATASGHDIHNREPLNGEDRLHWPIQDLNLQNKFNNNGLCFTVFNGSNISNERCVTRPITQPQGQFMGKTVESYGPSQDIEHTSYVVVGTGGDKLKLLGNSWKKIDYDYNVTANTMLSFDFRSTHQQPEINGIGFIMDGASAISSARTWQVYGTQNYGNQSHHNYSGDDWVSYRIPIGETFTGNISDMVFIGDEDNNGGQNVTYRSPVLYEDAPLPLRGYAFDTLKNGHGMFIGKASGNNRYLVYFYSYDSANQPEWFYSIATYSNNRLFGDINEVSYSANNNSNTQQIVGSFTLDYNNGAVDANTHCNDVNRALKPGALQWSINDQSGNWCMQPFFTNGGVPEIPDSHSGVWYEDGSNAWGASVQTIGSGNSTESFAVIYYYDTNGKARWASSYDASATSNDHNYNMLHTTGYSRTGSGDVSHLSIGSAGFIFGTAPKATININYPEAPNGSLNKTNVNIATLAQ